MESAEDLVDDYGVTELAAGVYSLEADEEQIQENKTTESMVTGASAIMDELLNWFDGEIAWADSIDGLSPESEYLTDQILAKQRVKKFMTEAKSRLVTLKNEHLPE